MLEPVEYTEGNRVLRGGGSKALKEKFEILKAITKSSVKRDGSQFLVFSLTTSQS